jgi:hypothetical protein
MTDVAFRPMTGVAFHDPDAEALQVPMYGAATMTDILRSKLRGGTD